MNGSVVWMGVLSGIRCMGASFGVLGEYMVKGQ